MKIFSIILLLSIFKLNAQTDSTFTIKGRLNGISADQFIYLQNIENGIQITDSIKTVAGQFSFIGGVEKPTLYRLSIGKSSKESFPFFLENSEITLNCDYKSPFGCEVKGSYNQHLVDEFAVREKLAWNAEVIESLKNTYSNYNEKAGYIRKQRFTEAIKSFVLLHPSDKAVAYLVSLNSNYILDEDLENIYQSFGTNLKKSEFAEEVRTEVNMRSATKIGKVLNDIKQKDLNGDVINLFDFRGKYVLLHFWASGFLPSRLENQKLRAIYKKYQNQNFDVISVSLDSLEVDWNRAVLEDNLDWTNVSDLKGWNNAIAKKLSIETIPYSLLLDKDGAIIGRDMRPEELDNILNLITSTANAQKASNEENKSKPFFERMKKLLPKRKSKTGGGALPGAKR
jgi:peroxiredoxin